MKGLLTLFASLIVFPLFICIGIVFNIFYPFVMCIKTKSIKTVFNIYFRLIKGTYYFIDGIFYDLAYKLDELGNVWGEWFEDAITPKEKTLFGDEKTTVSASIGELKYRLKHINKFGGFIDNLLNSVFNQTNHTKGSYQKKLALKKLKDKNLLGNK